MSFVKVDLQKSELENLISENKDAKDAYEAFLAEIASQDHVNSEKNNMTTMIDTELAYADTVAAITSLRLTHEEVFDSLRRYVKHCSQMKYDSDDKQDCLPS